MKPKRKNIWIFHQNLGWSVLSAQKPAEGEQRVNHNQAGPDQGRLQVEEGIPVKPCSPAVTSFWVKQMLVSLNKKKALVQCKERRDQAHGAVFFLDYNAKRIGFWEVCSPSAAGIHTPLSKRTAERFSMLFSIQILEKKKSQNPPKSPVRKWHQVTRMCKSCLMYMGCF